MALIPPLAPSSPEALCKALGDTDTGLTGSEIEVLLAEAGLQDPGPVTKWRRLQMAFVQQQTDDKCSNRVIAFVQLALAPARYVGRATVFEKRRHEVNVVLAFEGLECTATGNVRRRERASTLAEAEGRASLMRKALAERRVHPEVLKFCQAELLVDNYFHAVLEATKSVASRLRQLAEIEGDGSGLADRALMPGSSGHPRLALNACSTDSELSEQKGFAFLVKGLFGAFRNPTAHAPRVEWPLSEQDALDILTTVSYVHRRLDRAVRTHVK
jgi:uncharacterized protein (TIGR02391 family)